MSSGASRGFPGIASRNGVTVRYDRRQFVDRGLVVTYDTLEVTDLEGGTATLGRRPRGWVVSSIGAHFNFVECVRAGVLVGEYCGPSCYGHTDYVLAPDLVADVLEGVTLVGVS